MYDSKDLCGEKSHCFLRLVILQTISSVCDNIDLFFHDAKLLRAFRTCSLGMQRAPDVSFVLILYYLGYYDCNIKKQLINCVENQQFKGENFKIFHGVWESLLRSLVDNKNMYIKEIYNSSNVITAQNFKDLALSLLDKYHHLSKKCSFKEDCVNLLKQMHDGQKEYLCQVIHYKDSDSGFGVMIPSLGSLIRSNTIHMTLIGFCKAELDIDNYWKDIVDNYEKCQKSVN